MGASGITSEVGLGEASNTHRLAKENCCMSKVPHLCCMYGAERCLDEWSSLLATSLSCCNAAVDAFCQVSHECVPARPSTQVMGYFHVPEVHLMELARGPSYLFYKMVEAAVQQLEGVLLSYRKALVGCEEHTFKRVSGSGVGDEVLRMNAECSLH